eukprot:14730750-Alexandrium_andersonii.AAC.1
MGSFRRERSQATLSSAWSGLRRDAHACAIVCDGAGDGEPLHRASPAFSWAVARVRPLSPSGGVGQCRWVALGRPLLHSAW